MLALLTVTGCSQGGTDGPMQIGGEDASAVCVPAAPGSLYGVGDVFSVAEGRTIRVTSASLSDPIGLELADIRYRLVTEDHVPFGSFDVEGNPEIWDDYDDLIGASFEGDGYVNVVAILERSADGGDARAESIEFEYESNGHRFMTRTTTRIALRTSCF